jgi:hypothetical protein
MTRTRGSAAARSGEDLARVVARAVVDADEFEVHGNAQHASGDFGQRCLLVIDRHHDR